MNYSSTRDKITQQKDFLDVCRCFFFICSLSIPRKIFEDEDNERQKQKLFIFSKLFIRFDLLFFVFIFFSLSRFIESSAQFFFSYFSPDLFLITTSFEQFHDWFNYNFLISIFTFSFHSTNFDYHPEHNLNFIHMLTDLFDVSKITEHCSINAESI